MLCDYKLSLFQKLPTVDQLTTNTLLEAIWKASQADHDARRSEEPLVHREQPLMPYYFCAGYRPLPPFHSLGSLFL